MRRWHRCAYDLPGHAHALTFSCYRRLPLLSSDRTCSWLAESIEQAQAAFDFGVWAYVFMPEHVHLLIRPRREDYVVAKILYAIKLPVAKRAIRHVKQANPAWLSKLTRRRGRRTEHPFWQSGGGYDRNITSPAVARATIDYVHMNPVRRGLVPRPDQWHWSSASWYEGERTGPITVEIVEL